MTPEEAVVHIETHLPFAVREERALLCELDAAAASTAAAADSVERALWLIRCDALNADLERVRLSIEEMLVVARLLASLGYESTLVDQLDAARAREMLAAEVLR